MGGFPDDGWSERFPDIRRHLETSFCYFLVILLLNRRSKPLQLLFTIKVLQNNDINI